VLDYDTAQSITTWGERTVALENLGRHRSAVAEACAVNPSVVLLSGEPAHVLQGHALSNHYDVLVIGRRGSGASKALLGSVATRITSGRHADSPRRGFLHALTTRRDIERDAAPRKKSGAVWSA
jgi:nucleotide-binding universal stress UspA family protein